MTISSPHKAVALLSGGLDSMLAILTLLGQGIPVSALRFSTPFEARVSSPTVREAIQRSFDESIGFVLEVRDLGDEMLDIVRTPKHGYGKNMNPCIDCRILMLRKAKQFMDTIGADFLVTGEVLGQRPMSQRKDMLYHMDKEAGVAGIVLRPLSAKLLMPTIPEQQGIVDREKLYAFSGRSRRPQMALARAFNLRDYPPPAGGCLLTEPNYAMRLKDLLTHDADPAMRDIHLLKTGRHFRFSPRCKIVVGRDKTENTIIETLAKENDYLLRVESVGSPVTLVTGEITDECLKIAAQICARYADVKNCQEVTVRVFRGRRSSVLSVSPAAEEILGAIRIGRKQKAEKAKV